MSQHIHTENNSQICCPHCLTEYDLSEAKPCYIQKFCGEEETFLIGLCPDCQLLITKRNKSTSKRMARQSWHNIWCHSDKWLSVTNEVAMLVNDHNFSDALLNGHGLSRSVYDAIMRGNYFTLPFAGPGLMISWD